MQRQRKAKMRNIWVLRFGASFIRDFTVRIFPVNILGNHFKHIMDITCHYMVNNWDLSARMMLNATHKLTNFSNNWQYGISETHFEHKNCEILFVQNIRFFCPNGLKFCTEYDSITAVVYAKLQNDQIFNCEMSYGKHNLTIFKFKMRFARILHKAPEIIIQFSGNVLSNLAKHHIWSEDILCL